MNDTARQTPRTFRWRGIQATLLLVLFLVAASWLLVHTEADRALAARFYQAGSGWPDGDGRLWQWLYQYGTIPGLLLTLGALAGYAASFRGGRLRTWRRDFLLIFLTAVVGGGVLVNAFFKPYWGRPRPRQVIEFGGQWQYREFFRPGVPGKGQSFPCGHCTMGFVFCSLVFARRRSWVAATAGGIGGLAYGGLLGLCRMIQGAHFATDVLWSFGLLMVVAVVLHYFILPRSGPAKTRRANGRRNWMVPVFLMICIGIVLAFLTRRPFYETRTELLAIEPAVRRLVVNVDAPIESRHVRYGSGKSVQVGIRSRGFGWSLSKVRYRVDTGRRGTTLLLFLHVDREGYFSELNHRVEVHVPQSLEARLAVDVHETDPGKGIPPASGESFQDRKE